MKRTLTISAILTIWLILAMSPAVRAAGVSIRAYFTSAFTDTTYQRNFISKVIANWKPTAETPPVGKKTVYILRLNREGQVSYKKLHMSSGSQKFDQDAEKCIDRAAPFDPLPSSFRYPYLEVHVHFEVVK